MDLVDFAKCITFIIRVENVLLVDNQQIKRTVDDELKIRENEHPGRQEGYVIANNTGDRSLLKNVAQYRKKKWKV
jgi:hypothetical protein